jgi:hypothetical protein
MRETAGFVAFHLAFAVPGMALLYALGMVRRPRDVLAAVGPAYLAGIAAVMTILLAGLSAGAAIRLPVLVVVSGAVTVGLAVLGFVLARRRRAPLERTADPPGSAERWVGRAVLGLLAAFFVIGYSAFVNSSTLGDDWTIWSYKALALFHLGGSVDELLFTRSDLGPAHPYYPMLQPLFQSLFFRSVGQVQLQEFHAVLWILFGSFIWTMVWLGRSRGLPLLLVLIPAAAMTFTSKSHALVTAGYADVTVAALAGAGALCIGIWVRDHETPFALLGAVFLAGAANTKNEGVMAAGVILAVAFVFVLAQRRRGWQAWLAAAGLVVAGAIPWMLWRGANDVESEFQAPPGEALGNLEHTERIPKSFTAIFDRLADGGQYGFLVPCLLVLTVTCLVRNTARSEAAYYLAVPVVMTLGLVFVYWTGTLEIDYWLDNSADRTVAGIVFVCGGGLIHLVALLLSQVGPARTHPDRPHPPPP